MNEEKQGIKFLEEYIRALTYPNPFIYSREEKIEGLKKVINLLKKQQKEIENRLNEIKDLYNFISIREERIDELAEINEKYNDTYISKDEIRHIRDKAECMDYYSLNDVIDDLSKLLGDENNE